MKTQHGVCVVALLVSVFTFGDTARAGASAPCPGDPDAIGVSRTITVDPAQFPRLGHMQYRQSLPLADHEVVLTFDDGPLPPYTDRVLSILAKNCVKATFFLVGRHTAANPAAARRVAAAGHTIGTHSQNHILHFDEVSEARAENEVDSGIRTIKAALGEDVPLAPFFRIPGLGRTHAVERYLERRSLVVWSADTVADDWTPISAQQVLNRALARLEAMGRGILLLHDIQPRTVLMLPRLLAELKRRNFRIVHVVSTPAEPVTPPLGPVLLASARDKLGWPRIVSADPNAIPTSLAEVTATAAESKEQGAPASEPVPLPPRKKVKRHRAVSHVVKLAARGGHRAISRVAKLAAPGATYSLVAIQ